MWSLCVVVLWIGGPRQCISTWPAETQCWDAGREWGQRVKLWEDRSGLREIYSYACFPGLIWG
jgi:hypothetical protein